VTIVHGANIASFSRERSSVCPWPPT
jgi:hypothetical protein